MGSYVHNLQVAGACTTDIAQEIVNHGLGERCKVSMGRKRPSTRFPVQGVQKREAFEQST